MFLHSHDRYPDHSRRILHLWPQMHARHAFSVVVAAEEHEYWFGVAALSKQKKKEHGHKALAVLTTIAALTFR